MRTRWLWTQDTVALVKLKLANHHPDSLVRRVTINLASGVCTYSDKRKVSLSEFLECSDFKHPLLDEPVTSSEHPVYHYEYDSLQGLFRSGIYVYSTLLRASKPQACQFKINPASTFPHRPLTEAFYFSMNYQQVAQEQLPRRQLEVLISYFCQIPFQFLDDILIQDQFEFCDLPRVVDGDALYQQEIELTGLVQRLIKANVPSRYELRLINQKIGFGVFCRQKLQKDDLIGVYAGVKSINVPLPHYYAFLKGSDCLGMQLDGRHYGNMTRFINHAPSATQDEQDQNAAMFLTANVKAQTYNLQGIVWVVYQTMREIAVGEQLLVDYGSAYWSEGSADISQFNRQGQLVERRRKSLWSRWRYRLFLLRTMAKYGVEKAQRYLLLRTLLIAGVVVVLVIALNSHSRL